MPTTERDKRLRELMSKKANDAAVISQGQAEILGMQSELQSSLAAQQLREKSNMETNQLMQQMALNAMATENSQPTVTGQVGRMNGYTQNMMSRYGLKPENSRQSKSNTVRMVSGANTTNVKNETITNNHTDIKITQPSIPIAQPQIPISQPSNRQGSGTVEKFKAWMSQMFAKQQNEAEIQRKEFRKKEWSLGRDTTKLMKRISSATSGLADKLNPETRNQTLMGQLKWLLLLFGAGIVGKYWGQMMKWLDNLEGGFRLAFGFDMNENLTKNSGKSKSFITQIQDFLGVSHDKPLIAGFREVIMDGVDRLKKSFELFLEDRSMSLKAVKFPDINTPDLGILGNVLGPMMDGITSSLKGVGQYLGDLITVALGGSKGRVKVEARRIARKSMATYTNTEGHETSGGDNLLARGQGRDYLRKNDFNALGQLSGNASSTQAMSRHLIGLLNDRSNKSHTAEIANGIEQLFNVADRQGSVVISPDLLSSLGISLADIRQLKSSGNLKTVPYKLIKARPNENDLREDGRYFSGFETAGNIGGEALGWVAGGALGGVFRAGKLAVTAAKAGRMARAGRLTMKGGKALTKGAIAGGILGKLGGALGSSMDASVNNSRMANGVVWKLVPADSREQSIDGSPAIMKPMISLSKAGADFVTARLAGKGGEASLTNEAFYNKIQDIEYRKKRSNGVRGALTSSIGVNDLKAGMHEYALYENKQDQIWDAPGPWNTTTTNLGNAITNMAQSGINMVNVMASKITGGGKGRVSTAELNRRVNYCMKFFMDRGLTKGQAAGIVGNLYREGLAVKDLGYEYPDGNPTSRNYGPSAGIAGFHDPRGGGGQLSMLKEFARMKGLNWKDLDTQLQFLWEGSPDSRKALNKIMQETNGMSDAGAASRASYLWGYNYERFAGYDNASGAENYRQRASSALGIIGSYDPGDINYTNYSGDYVGTAINKVKSFLGITGSSGLSLEEQLTPQQQKARNKLLEKFRKQQADNKSRWLGMGAKEDETGRLYIAQGDARVYINIDSTGQFGMSEDDIDFVTGSKPGKYRELSDEETTLIKKSTVREVNGSYLEYPEKGGTKDWIENDKGGPMLFDLGTFKDIQNFKNGAEHTFKNGIPFRIAVSRDLTRYTIVDIKKKWPITRVGEGFDIYGDEKSASFVHYGQIIYREGGKWIRPDTIMQNKKAYIPYQPICLLNNVRLDFVPSAVVAAEKLLNFLTKISGLEKKGSDFYTRTGEKLTKDEINMAAQYGLLRKTIGGVTGITDKLNTVTGTVQKTERAIIKSELDNAKKKYGSSIEDYYKKHGNEFTVLDDGKIIDNQTRLQVGTQNNGKTEMFSYSQLETRWRDPSQLRKEIENNGRELERKNFIAANEYNTETGFVSRNLMGKYIEQMYNNRSNGKIIDKRFTTYGIDVPMIIHGKTLYVKSFHNPITGKQTFKISGDYIKRVFGLKNESFGVLSGSSIEKIRSEILARLEQEKQLMYGNTKLRDQDDRAASVNDLIQTILSRGAEITRIDVYNKGKLSEKCNIILSDGTSIGFNGKESSLGKNFKEQVNRQIRQVANLKMKGVMGEAFTASGLEKSYDDAWADYQNNKNNYSERGNGIFSASGDQIGVIERDNTGKIIKRRKIGAEDARIIAFDEFSRTEEAKLDFYRKAFGKSLNFTGAKKVKVGDYSFDIDTSKKLSDVIFGKNASAMVGDIYGTNGKKLEGSNYDKALKQISDKLQSIYISGDLNTKALKEMDLAERAAALEQVKRDIAAKVTADTNASNISSIATTVYAIAKNKDLDGLGDDPSVQAQVIENRGKAQYAQQLGRNANTITGTINGKKYSNYYTDFANKKTKKIKVDGKYLDMYEYELNGQKLYTHGLLTNNHPSKITYNENGDKTDVVLTLHQEVPAVETNTAPGTSTT